MPKKNDTRPYALTLSSELEACAELPPVPGSRCRVRRPTELTDNLHIYRSLSSHGRRLLLVRFVLKLQTPTKQTGGADSRLAGWHRWPVACACIGAGKIEVWKCPRSVAVSKLLACVSNTNWFLIVTSSHMGGLLLPRTEQR